MKKRIISILLAVVMIAGMLPLGAITAFAEESNSNYFGITAANGTDKSTHVPFIGYFNDQVFITQCIYPENMLDTHGTITQMTFYTSDNYSDLSFDGTYAVALMKTNLVNFDGLFAVYAEAQTVYQGELKVSRNQMVIPFIEPYEYDGGNLLLTVYTLQKGNSFKQCEFLGCKQSYATAVYGYSTSGRPSSSESFIPKTTFRMEGSEDKTYHIKSASDWSDLATAVANGDTFAGKTVSLDADIETDKVIGNWAEDGSQKYFSGTFDGGGHTITFTNTDNTSNKGVFAYTVGAEISNLKIDGEIKGDWSLGGVVGCAKDTKITNCENRASVTSTGTGNIAYAGGIVGVSEGGNVISGCKNFGSVTGNKAIGGIIGEARDNDEIKNCINEGTVSGYQYIGGILGNTPDEDNSITVANCINYGNITVTADDGGNAGGIAGHMAYGGTVENCFTSAVISGGNTNGVVVGWANRSFACNNLYYEDLTDNNGVLPFSVGDLIEETPTATPVNSKTDANMIVAMNAKVDENNGWYCWTETDGRVYLVPVINDTDYFYIENIGDVDADIVWKDDLGEVPNLRYSIDDKYSFVDFGGTATLRPGEICYFKGNNDNLYLCKITCSTDKALLAVGGDIGTLLNGVGNMAEYPIQAFHSLFKGLKPLVKIDDLTLCRADTVLAMNCFGCMFEKCTGLKSVPEDLLPALILASHCYDKMFQDCDNLTNSPDLPAQKLVALCYTRMFYGCESLKSVKVMFTQWSSDTTLYFLPTNPKELYFYCPNGLDTNSYGDDRLPSNKIQVIKQCLVTFDLQGYENPEDVKLIAPVLLKKGKKIEAPPDPSNERYVLGGWYKEPECINPWDFENDTVTDDMTLYAKCIVGSCTLWFFLGDADDTRIPYHSARYGEFMKSVTPPVREGMVFLGYYDIGEMGTQSTQYFNAYGECVRAWDKEDSVACLVAHWAPAGTATHTHTFADTYSHNDTHHWRVCTCEDDACKGNVTGFAVHTFAVVTNDDGSKTYTCACGYTKTVYEGGSTEGEPVQGVVKCDGISLTLSSDIYINFYMQLTDEALANGKMVFTIGNRTVEGITAQLNESNNRYYFACPLNALEMAETVTATFTYGSTTYTQTYSVKKYVETILTATDEDGKFVYTPEMQELARKIANYGYHAQYYLESIHSNVTIGEGGYKEMLSQFKDNVDVTKAKELQDKFTATADTDNLTFDGRTVYFDSATALNFYVITKDGNAPTATCDKGKTVEVKLYKDKTYIVSVKDISATELGDTFTVTIGEGTDSMTLKGSVLDYCAAVINAHRNKAETKDTLAINAMAAFYEYHEAAKAYVSAANN